MNVPPQPEPWNLTRFPNYDEALSIDTIAADSISQDEFLRNYVETNTPCLLKGAARHWPACTTWRSLSHLKDRTERHATVQVNYKPISELNEQIENFPHVRFHDFLEKLAITKGFIRGCGQLNPKGGLAKLVPDLGTYQFLHELLGSRVYDVYRFMIYRQSYSDWHFHPSDETLMTQVMGAKEILLLPPDETSWNALLPIMRATNRGFDVDVERFSDFLTLRPFRVFSTPGDALYIPVFWWHAVESLDSDIGATVPATWGSPMSVITDERFPAVRAQKAVIRAAAK